MLQSIYLTGCGKITDAGISALGRGCRELPIIDHGGCDKMTDVGISVLGAGCGDLLTIDSTGCGKVTAAGVSDAAWVLCEGRPPHISR